MAKSIQGNKRLVRHIVLAAFSIAGLTAMFLLLINGHNLAVFAPAGIIADKQKSLIILTMALAAFVVIPVFTLLFVVAWKYREGNTKARYTPNVAGNKPLELLWWGIPTVIIMFLGFVAWQSSHELDPYKALAGDKDQVVVQVVALEWKWLFIYPEYGVASVNYLPIPEKTPISFHITSDAPMNSFWIPNLGGQVYAMSGMSTQLHLQADSTGIYRGSSANISGAGFASMKFNAESMSQKDFDGWVAKTSESGHMLDSNSYAELALQSTADAPKAFRLMNSNLYNEIIMKYMMPKTEHEMKQGMTM